MKQMTTRIMAILLLAFSTGSSGWTQVSINNDNSQPDPSAFVDVKSTEKGFLIPRLTTAQRDSIINPAEGLSIYNTDSKTIEVFNGDIWTLNTGKFVCGISQVKDTYGNRYPTALIGTQCWMAQNLSAGIMIPGTQNQALNSAIEKYCYGNSSESCDVYGGLYQWREMMGYGYGGPQGICPDGWHLPTLQEWNTLFNTLGGWTVAGGKLKEAGSAHWQSPNTGTNSSGFSARGAGYRDTDATFDNLLLSGSYWTTSEEDETYATALDLGFNTDAVVSSGYNKNTGLSVRCVKNPFSLNQ
jgi:uncharacterized protein (TIGR02145 family)